MAASRRLGLIGAGRWGKVYLKTLAELADACRLTHLCTSNPRNADGIIPPVTVVSGWRDVLRSDCEAVIIATPPATHATIVEACLEARKPCLVEKPLCLDVDTAERLTRRIEDSGVPVLVDHTQLFSPAYRTLKQALGESGASVRWLAAEGMGWGPFRTHTPALWDWAPHDLSLCLDLLGESPHTVDALGGPAVGGAPPGGGGLPGPDGAVEQYAIRLEFPSDAVAWIHGGRLSPQRRRTLTVATDTTLYLLDELAPERVRAAPVQLAARYAPEATADLALTPVPIRGDGLPLANAVRYFLEGLSGGDRALFGGALALEITRVLAAADARMQQRAGAAGTSPLPRARVIGRAGPVGRAQA